MESTSQNNNYKGYRFVSIQHTPSLITNNLTTNDGEYFVYINNQEPTPNAVIYSRDVLEKGDVQESQSI